MDTVWFLYTCLLLAIALASCTLSLAVWMATRRRDCLISAAVFIIYAVELSLIFFDEYANGKYGYPQSLDLPLTHPYASATLSVLFTGALWAWMLVRLHRPITRKRWGLPVAIYAVLAFVLVPKEGMSSVLQQWAYWATRDLTLITMLGYACWRYRHAATEAERLDLARSRRFFVLTVVLAFCILAEDTFMILIFRPVVESAFEAQLFWHLSERNISENVLMIACAVQLLRRNQRVLSMYFNHPPVVEGAGIAQSGAAAPAPAATAAAPAQSSDGASSGERGVSGPLRDARQAIQDATASARAAARFGDDELESRVLLFADDHGLSVRECDVLRELLRGKDTQNIASALTISTGTVKAHLHRIYQKVEVSGRDELMRVFWSS